VLQELVFLEDTLAEVLAVQILADQQPTVEELVLVLVDMQQQEPHTQAVEAVEEHSILAQTHEILEPRVVQELLLLDMQNRENR
jgi:DNA topoisomerase VI subunit B